MVARLFKGKSQNAAPQLQSSISHGPSSVSQTHSSVPMAICALCGLPTNRRIVDTINNQSLTFCCYGCRHVYEIVAPDLAQGLALPQAMGRAGLDLKSPCCRGIIQGDPAEEAASLLSRLMLNAFLAMMVMVLSLALYSDFFFSDWGELGQGTRSMLQAIAMLFATPAVLMLALPILEDAIFTFQVYRRLTTSALIAVGSLAAYGLSVYATFTGTGHTYFETATMTLLLVTLGRWLDARTQVEGNKALDKLLARTPAEASLVLPDERERRVPVDQLRPGDRIRVRPGENFAVDGQVLGGEGSVEEASVTGESTPAYKGPGHTVYAGTINLDGSFVVEATHTGDDRVMGKLIRLLEEARLKRAPIEQLADQVAAYFTPAVMVLAGGTLLFWTWQAGFETGLLTGLAVLLIACPCALGVATPLTLWAALGRAAQKGVLIRDSLTLEKLSRVRRIFLDKTGTLTTGRPTLTDIVCDPQLASPDVRLLQFAAALEQGSEHPLAYAIRDAAEKRRLAHLPVDKFRALPGLGVTGWVDGQPIWVGNWRLVEQQKLALSGSLQQARERLEQAGLTVVHVGWQGRVQGLLALAETLRPTAQAALAEMHQQALAVQVLTGDSNSTANTLSQMLGVSVQSELLPHDKVKAIETAEAEAPVAMVGDGLNDAPALARATVGIALGCGTDITREAADISLLGNDLTLVTWTTALARRVYRTIGWNLAWAFTYNVIGIGLAMAGLLHPVLAAAAMVLSSALVVGNSLRVFKF
ncbi:MAG: heavy metal translocating P-type ATPase [Anaerolineales bacterium]|nr:heavy metal translocating P-type ATPase [Anaerolineales bacterium]